MPDTRKHRGPHPRDAQLFGPDEQSKLLRAIHDYSWLISRGYAEPSALKLVCDHFELTDRQRLAVMRSSCREGDRTIRAAKAVPADDLRGQELWLDGYNVLTTLEVALGGGVILRGRDNCLRDIAGLHGTYRKVEETVPALALIGEFLARLGVEEIRWFLDAPVSNSGRLCGMIRQTAEEKSWPWQVDLVPSPDGVLVRTEHIVATSDSEILNRCRRWYNLTADLVAERVPHAFLVDLSL